MLSPIIHTIWMGPKTAVTKARIKAIKDMNPSMEVWEWDDKTIPSLLPGWAYSHSTLAGASNVIRLHAIREFSGIYLDVDFVPIKPFDELLVHSAFVARQPDGVLCNACFGAERDHPWIRTMIDNYGDQRLKGADWGCHIMEPFLTNDVTILPTETFYPYGHDEEPRPPTPLTVAMHLWDGSWVDATAKASSSTNQL